MSEKLKVIIRCLVYNHEPYLRDCLEGFVMQKTDFPFRAVVHDDCSTDGSAAIIREYAEKYPDIIEPIFETENLYSRRDGSLRRVMNAATYGRSEYIALCEGDDYWIDPHKLQKQVDFFDSHPDIAMVCSNAEVEYEGRFLTEADFRQMSWPICDKSGLLPVQDVVENGGWFIHTCTILYRGRLVEDYPEAAKNCSVGDYPLQIFAALKGGVYYLHEKTAVYRFCSVGSWTARARREPTERDVIAWSKIVKLFEVMNQYSLYQHDRMFKNAARAFVTGKVLRAPHLLKSVCQHIGYVFLQDYMPTISEKQSLIQKIKMFLLKLKWYPFDLQNVCVLLRQMSVRERWKLGKMCKASKR